MEIDFACFSDKGDRGHNEDYIGNKQLDKSYLFILADGLGGHGKGEVASKLVVENSCSMFTENNLKDESFLNSCFDTSQELLLDEQDKTGSAGKMKTTMVILYFDDKVVKYGHIGDSRLYLIKNNKIISRTNDHSVPQMLVNAGEIKEKEIRHHEDRNRLLRAMGTEWDPESPRYQIDETELVLETGMAFLLCSDGFWEWIVEKDMEKMLKKYDTAKESLDNMIEKVKKAGNGKNMDNFSAILIKIN